LPLLRLRDPQPPHISRLNQRWKLGARDWQSGPAAIAPIADIRQLWHSDHMNTAFDASWDSAFKGSPFHLRFELGGEYLRCQDAPVPRFVQALTRARKIREAVFANSSQVSAIVGSMVDTSNDFFSLAPNSYKRLADSGFRATPIAEWLAPLDPEGEDFIWKAFDVTADVASRDVLLWNSIAYEMPIEPNSPVLSYLVDLERGILLNVYDDRGMDIIATTAGLVTSYYTTFDSWLLDYDRERMRAVFA